MLNPKDIRSRLAFIRHLHRVATEQSKAPEPMQAASVLGFHDAVELFLHLVFEHLEVGGATPHQFMDYWDRIAKAAMPAQVTGRAGMERLNGARRELKHRGTHPSPREVEAFRGSVTSFLEDNVRAIFSLDFDRISMIDLVISDSVRALLRDAEAAIAGTNYGDAARNLAIAFELLLGEHDVIGDLAGSRPYYTDIFGEPFTSRDSAKRWAADVAAQLASILRVTVLDFDYRRFKRFQQIAPRLWHVGGEFLTAGQLGQPTAALRQPSKDECEEALQFVVDCALRVQQ